MKLSQDEFIGLIALIQQEQIAGSSSLAGLSDIAIKTTSRKIYEWAYSTYYHDLRFGENHLDALESLHSQFEKELGLS